MHFILHINGVLNRLHVGHVITVLASAHQEFPVSQETRDPRDQQVLRGHPAIMDPKEPWVHEDTKVKKEPVEERDLEGPKEVQGLQVHVETKAT